MQHISPDLVRIFCSYAREDGDFLQAILQMFTELNELANHNIVTFSDYDIKTGDSINSTITDKLDNTDIFVLIHTEAKRTAYSYPGWELGYFWSLINADKRTNGSTSRRVVSFYLKDPPDMIGDALGIPMYVERTDLDVGREEYLEALVDALPEDMTEDPFTRFISEVAELSEARRPSVGDAATKAKRAERIASHIKKSIYPTLRGKIYDCISGRVERRFFEQLSLKIELPRESFEDDNLPISDDAVITFRSERGPTFGTLFNTVPGARVSWGEFKSWITRSDGPYGNVLFAIEQAVHSAVVSNKPVDNDQVIRLPNDGKLYRIIVTEHFEYYDGRRTVYMWLIPFLNFRSFGDSRTTILLSFIVLSAKYRFLFLEEESQYAFAKMKLVSDPEILKRTILSVLREIVLIEEESRAMELDGADAFLAIVAKDVSNQLVQSHVSDYGQARIDLQTAASNLLDTDTSAGAFAERVASWWAALEQFVSASRVINETYTTSALENLSEKFKGRPAARTKRDKREKVKN